MSLPSFLNVRTGVVALLVLAGAAAGAYLCFDTPVDATPQLPVASADAQARPLADTAAIVSPRERDDMVAQAVQRFHIGYAGGLQLDEETRTTLDALVNSLPEAPTADDLARVEKALRLSLPYEDAERALKLVHGYIGYRTEVSGLLASSEPPASADALRQLFAQVDAIQHRHFSSSAEQALFGPRAQEARNLLEIMVVQQDATLTAEQKQARIDALQTGSAPGASAPAGVASRP